MQTTLTTCCCYPAVLQRPDASHRRFCRRELKKLKTCLQRKPCNHLFKHAERLLSDLVSTLLCCSGFFAESYFFRNRPGGRNKNNSLTLSLLIEGNIIGAKTRTMSCNCSEQLLSKSTLTFVLLVFFRSLANEASWPSITKSASDWRAISPEQVESVRESCFYITTKLC